MDFSFFKSTWGITILVIAGIAGVFWFFASSKDEREGAAADLFVYAFVAAAIFGIYWIVRLIRNG